MSIPPSNIPLMSLPTFYNIHESPGTYFKEAIREIRCRIKLCELYSAYLDDFANVEDIYGKIIVKIGSNARGMKDDWPIETNHTLDQLQTTTEKIGKQHLGYSLCISQSISRDFGEYARTTTRRINELELKIQASADEVLKNSKVWKKKYGRYIRLFQDAEGSIVSRDSAIREYAEKINSTPEEGFFNRSITMVLGKVAPNDSIKKQHDKCRILVHELDLIETDLNELKTVLCQQQEDFNTALSAALQEIEEIENERLNFIQTGLLRFYQANTGMSDHLTQIFETLKSLISALDIHVDVEAFERELEVAKFSFRDRSNSMQQHLLGIATERKSGEILSPYNEKQQSQQQSSLSPTPETSSSIGMPLSLAESTRYKSEEDEASRLLRSNLMIFDRLKDGIDLMKRSAQRATGTFAEISDAEKHYSKAALKVLDKHGYGYGATGAGTRTGAGAGAGHISHTSLTSNKISNSFVSTESKLRELVNLYESTFSRNGWENVIQVTEKLSEAHLTVAEVLLDKCCVITDNAQRKMETIVKEAIEKVNQINKKIDGAKASQMRLKSKLNRVQKELKDRRIAANSPRKAFKEDMTESGQQLSSLSQHGHHSGGGGGGAYAEGGESERLSDLSLTDPTSNLGNKSIHQSSGNELTETPSSSSSSSAQGSFSMQRGRSEKGMIQGWESLGNAFGVVAVTALGAAGVLESSLERNHNRIANLEEEEAACLESLITASASTQVVTDLCVNDLSAIIMSLKQSLSKEMENLKSSLMLFIDGQTVGLNISINVLGRLKYTTDSIDLAQDLSHFHANIINATLTNEEKKIPNLYKMPVIEEFICLRNELVDLERLNEKESQTLISNDPPLTSPHPLRQQSRGNSSEGEDLYLTSPPPSASASAPHSMTDEMSSTHEFETTRTPMKNLEETFPSEDVDVDSDPAVPVTVTVPVTVEGSFIKRPQQLSTQDSDSLTPVPLIAPSECSVPDYDEATIREVHSENHQTMTKLDHSTTITATPDKYSQDSNSTLIIRTTSHEIGTFASSSQEGLRRSVNTEHHPLGGVSDMQQMDDTTHTCVPLREETWASPELAKFDLPPTEKVLEYFSCALYPKRGLLTHGRLFITNRFLAFSGWPETRVILELQKIENVEKKQVFFIPNALSVNSNGEEYFFGSFLDRDLCYRMLTSMVMIAKSLNEITGDATDSSHSGDSNGKKPQQQQRKNSLRLGNGNGNDENEDGKDESEEEEEDSSSISGDNSDTDDYDDGRPYDGYSKYPDYLNLMTAANVSCVYDVSTSLASSLIWRYCWQDKGHFTNFLTSVGDFDILATDWIPFTSSLTKAQDPLGLKFQYKRTVDYLHPRTSMLMFGPKNATAKQIQYLSLPELDQESAHGNGATAGGEGEGKSPHFDISSLRKARHGCILTATQFEGIPMSDVFEVLQYWTFQKVSPERSMIRVGVTVNFLKGTLVKGQILAGTKEELTVLSKQWCDYSIATIEKYLENKPEPEPDRGGRRRGGRGANAMAKIRRKSSIKSSEDLAKLASVSTNLNTTTVTSVNRLENVSPPSAGGSNGSGNGFGQSHWIILVMLGLLILIQTILLYLLYRHIVLLDQNILDLKSFLQSSLTTLVNQSAHPHSHSPFASDADAEMSLSPNQDGDNSCHTIPPSDSD